MRTSTDSIVGFVIFLIAQQNQPPSAPTWMTETRRGGLRGQKKERPAQRGARKAQWCG